MHINMFTEQQIADMVQEFAGGNKYNGNHF